MVRAAPAAGAARAAARPHRAPPGGCGQRGRPARDRPQARAARGLRLRRRRRGRRARAAPVARGVRAGGAHPPCPRGRLGGRHDDDDPRPARGAAAGLRPHRLHAAVPSRGRARGGARGAADGDPHRSVDGGDDDDRGAGRRSARHTEVVPALPVARPRRQRGADPARAGRRLPRAGAHGRHRGGRLAPARRPQRARLPPAPDAAHAGRHGAASLVVGQRAHHRAAALRQPRVAAHHRRARGEPLRGGAQPGGRHLAARAVGRARW